MRFRWTRRRTASNARGEHVWLLRLGLGYWPCLKAPFLQLGIGTHLIDVWYGLPSYLNRAA